MKSEIDSSGHLSLQIKKPVIQPKANNAPKISEVDAESDNKRNGNALSIFLHMQEMNSLAVK